MATLLCCLSDDVRQCVMAVVGCLSVTPLWLEPRARARLTSALHCSLQGWRTGSFSVLQWSCLVPVACHFALTVLGECWLQES